MLTWFGWHLAELFSVRCYGYVVSCGYVQCVLISCVGWGWALSLSDLFVVFRSSGVCLLGWNTERCIVDCLFVYLLSVVNLSICLLSICCPLSICCLLSICCRLSSCLLSICLLSVCPLSIVYYLCIVYCLFIVDCLFVFDCLFGNCLFHRRSSIRPSTVHRPFVHSSVVNLLSICLLSICCPLSICLLSVCPLSIVNFLCIVCCLLVHWLFIVDCPFVVDCLFGNCPIPCRSICLLSVFVNCLLSVPCMAGGCADQRGELGTTHRHPFCERMAHSYSVLLLGQI